MECCWVGAVTVHLLNVVQRRCTLLFRFLGLNILIYLIRVDIIGWIGYLGWNLDGL